MDLKTVTKILSVISLGLGLFTHVVEFVQDGVNEDLTQEMIENAVRAEISKQTSPQENGEEA